MEEGELGSECVRNDSGFRSGGEERVCRFGLRDGDSGDGL